MNQMTKSRTIHTPRIGAVVIRTMALLGLFLVVASCMEEKRPQIIFPQTDLASSPFMPVPDQVIPTGDAFGIDRHTGIYVAADGELLEIAEYLSARLQSRTGLRLTVNGSEENEIHRAIYLNKDAEKGAEEYEIYISRDSLLINAGSAAGAFMAVQTLRQILPENSNDSLAEFPIWPIPTGKISDAPEFAYRGSMLDVARHFFSVEDVKKYIDVMAYYKLNVLHLGLTNDQGWRIEIKSWPRLAEVGGSTEVGGGPGGYYTQEEYKEIVAYAAEQFITIVPEVDMPGHTNAASVAYPFLNGNGKTPELYTGTRVGFSTWDARKDTVYSFIDDVVREISEITPGPYFHVGGDETHVTSQSDYIYFMERVEPIIRKYGKQMIGWDEMAIAKLDSSSIAQFWASEENAQKAVAQGMKVILSPAKKAYLDMQYDSLSPLGLHWAGYIPVDTAYQWNPASYTAGLDRDDILGVEAPLWSETISELSELEYLAFPRLPGYAELAWSKEENRDWESYRLRLAAQAPYFRRMEINYYKSPLIPWPELEAPEPALKD